MGNALRVAEKIKAIGITLLTALEAPGGIRHSDFNGRVCVYSGQLPPVYEDLSYEGKLGIDLTKGL